MTYADVILPLSLENSYTYRVPEDLEKSIAPGCRVIVHFGKKRYYTAIVIHVHQREPDSSYEIKTIHSLLDVTPILRRPQLKFWQWIASYYLCKLGDVYKAALPAGLKLESETVIMLNDAFEAKLPLRASEGKVLDALRVGEKLTISDLEKRTGVRNVLPVLSSLLSLGAIEVNEELKRGFTPKMQTFIRLAEGFKTEERLHEAFTDLKRAKKQEELLITYLELSHALNPALFKEVSQKELVESADAKLTTLKELFKKGILEGYEKEIGRLQVPVCRLKPPKVLTEAQLTAYNAIHSNFETHDVCLLYGATSSGKTEIHIHLIEEVMKMGRQALYLLPEIAITTQITERLAAHFGDRLLVYHSRFSDNERVEVWNKLLYANEPLLIVGVRSSLFLPFKDLGLIIVDEEHENSYKQQDPSPRYNARNASIVLANMHGAKTLLASASPSIDSYYNALTAKYGLVELPTRYSNTPSPEIIPVDLKELKRKKKMKKEALFSPLLIEKMEQALAKKEQVILFQNRRGFAPLVECKDCGYVPHCLNCDVSLTYHKRQGRLVCHYCGYSIHLKEECPECKGTDIRMMGFGTEKVEEEIASLFPAAKTDRLDFDTTRTKTAYERILADFDSGKTQILIGTQMISKGLDFANVSVVGIINADSLMNFPDFRAHERAYQLMAQVSGRAGRRETPGMVVLQTSQPEHPLIRMVMRSAYKEMVKLQLSERSMFKYPPYYRLITLVLRSRNETALRECATLYADKLRLLFGDRVLGPVIPVVTRVQTLYLRNIVLKIEIAASIASTRELLEKVYTEMQSVPSFRQIIFHYDVDPV
ncbi:primosomal protein N' [Massilibacteroides sp.]|uniref:replication restart helicase PriA n=1 Tax=Massilibacteroides sp. TaxID=2034766 RepID=UPI002603ED7D|nr:primosomal protein N' [Massilibacteroides sp.]MDD4514985.1 primosomal protein N' [Massilibacteroides sp.]